MTLFYVKKVKHLLRRRVNNGNVLNNIFDMMDYIRVDASVMTNLKLNLSSLEICESHIFRHVSLTKITTVPAETKIELLQF